MTDRHTFLYQDIAEPASLEVPSASSWMPEPNQPRKDSWAKKWSIAALTAVSLAYVGEPITPPETVTLDKWYQQLETPTPPKAGLHASLQQFAVHEPKLAQADDVKVTNWYGDLSVPVLPAPTVAWQQDSAFAGKPIVTETGPATELLAYPPLDLLPVTDGPITLQGEYVYVGPVAISDVRWLEPFSLPTIAKLRFDYPQEARVEVVAASAETITVDKWYRELSQPVKPEGYMVAGDNAFLSVEVTNIAWDVPFSEPLHAKPRLHASLQPFEFTDPNSLTAAEAVHAQWLVPFSVPFLPKPAVPQQQEFAFGQPPITADLRYDWLVPFNEPPKAREEVAAQQAVAFRGEPSDFLPPETITLDKWFKPLSEPTLPKPRVAWQQSYTVDPYILTQPEAVHIQWLQPLSEPQTAKRGPFGPDLAFVQAVSAAETVTLDKWYRALEEPVRSVLPRLDGFYALGQQEVSLAWLQSFTTPEQTRQAVPQQQDIAYGRPPFGATGDATELLVYPDLEVPPKAAPLRFEYPAIAFQGEPDTFVEPTPEVEGGHWGPDWHEERYWKKYDEEIRRKRREERDLRREIKKLVEGEQASPRQTPEPTGESVAPGEARHALQQRTRPIPDLKQPGVALDLAALRAQLDTVQAELRTLIEQRKAIRQKEENALLAILLMVS